MSDRTVSDGVEMLLKAEEIAARADPADLAAQTIAVIQTAYLLAVHRIWREGAPLDYVVDAVRKDAESTISALKGMLQ